MNDTGGPADHIATLLAQAPTTRDQLVDRMERLAAMAGMCADGLAGLRDATRRIAEPGPAASVQIASRRAEECLIELQIALSDLRNPRT
jgi:hypothetical protein